MKFPALTAGSLELYDSPGKGQAARDINRAVNEAAKYVIKSVGRRYSKVEAARAIWASFSMFVEPVAQRYSKTHGALDSEPRRACYSRIVHKVAERYDLDKWENDELYYEVY